MAKKVEMKTYTESIEWLANLGVDDERNAAAIKLVAFIYGKTEHSVRGSLTSKVLQISILKRIAEKKGRQG